MLFLKSNYFVKKIRILRLRESLIFIFRKSILLQRILREVEYATICAYFHNKSTVTLHNAKNMHLVPENLGANMLKKVKT